MPCDYDHIRILLFNLFNLVGQLKRLLAGEELNDRIGVEHVARENLGNSVILAFSPPMVTGQTIMEPALKKDTAGKCLKNLTVDLLGLGGNSGRPDPPPAGVLLVLDLHKFNVVPGAVKYIYCSFFGHLKKLYITCL